MHLRPVRVRDVLQREALERRFPPPYSSYTHSSTPSVATETIIEVYASISYDVSKTRDDYTATSTSPTSTPTSQTDPSYHNYPYPSHASTDRYGVYGDVPTPTPIPSGTPQTPINITLTTTDPQQIDDDFSLGEKAAIIIACILGLVAIIIASIWFCCGKPRRRRLKAKEEMQLHRERAEAAARAEDRPLGSSVQNLGTQIPVPPMEMTYSGVGPRQSIAPVQARGAVGRTASNVGRHVSLRGGGGDLPPTYEEAVPPTHQRLAGGMVQRGGPISVAPPLEEEDGAGMVADGKMPLSEIPFEDVVLDQQRSSPGESSSSSFEEGGRNFHTRHAQAGGDTTGHSNV